LISHTDCSVLVHLLNSGWLGPLISVPLGPAALTGRAGVREARQQSVVPVREGPHTDCGESVNAAFWDGEATSPKVTDVTPTPGKTLSQLVPSLVGILSVLGYKTGIPYPVGQERGGDPVSLSARVRGAAAAESRLAGQAPALRGCRARA
jgi:hypothetical protein